ncbi:hypothetical protein KC19_6G166700 [Ceratodon purpureus]|uniref:GPI-anchored protein LLG1-like domain-containing protein n=1 Tax=Ceratodon purpureus TaxID=3225 RepID=A0A8T0HFE0_CERPU|nr:hypothetical protein KC19_6G166700 [Ceratodon purpureus]
MAVTAKLRSAQLGVLVVVAFLCVVSAAAGNDDNEAGARAARISSRRLLQTVKPCPIDFATQNYTVVTSVCNATNPNMPVCCAAFAEFACPFASYLNDASTNCAVAMFTYLNMAGNYPKQMFMSCQGDANGVACPGLGPAPSPNPSSGAPFVPAPSPNPFSTTPGVSAPAPGPSSMATIDVPWRVSSLVIFLVSIVYLLE